MTEIAFENIREGDDIEVQWRLGDTLETRRGVAHEKSGNSWLTKDGLTLVTLLGNHVRILLHHRPAPAEPEGLGAIVRTAEGIEFVSVNRTPGTRRWVDAMIDDEHGERWALKWDDLEFDRDGIGVLYEGRGRDV